MKYANGFTLIELMMTIVIASVLLLAGVPSFNDLSKKNSLAAEVNALIADLQLARSEAIKRRQAVTVCKSTNLTSCATTGGWEQGRIILDDSGIVLRTHAPARGTITIRGTQPLANGIVFQGSGLIEGSGGMLVFCDDRIDDFATDRKKASVITVSNVGRVRSMKADEQNAITTCTPN